ncbi:hypothetical protein [Nocardia aurantiaca]|uniref:Secreted protein n=1 Tax=Nocardia aurantiaca TaxID=2675850 RepID=A0A6I3KZV3_9NOCA|nr:hypothetical protein [Nocardia aurantiaca]MTE15572.1 hypothetical protein [Nocardia aurantiaca]
MNARILFGAAVAAVAVTLAGNAVASADPIPLNPDDYKVGDTVYFAANASGCQIRPTGDVGCWYGAGGAGWFGLPVSDLVIDLPFLPAHPSFGLWGEVARPGAKSFPLDDGTYTLSYAGATCTVTGGAHFTTTCTSKGHSFTRGVEGTRFS